MRARHLLLAALAGAATLVATPGCAQPSGPLTVVVTHVRRALGHVRVEVCSQAEFLKTCVHGGATPALAGTTVVEVPDLPAGRYAIQAYLDENDNRQVDQNFIGIPKEGVGFSQDAPFNLGPPKFKRAAFDHGDEAQTVTLRLRYLPG